MVDKVIKLLMLFSPIFFTTGISLDKMDVIFFQIGAMILFISDFLDGDYGINFNFGLYFPAVFLLMGIVNLIASTFNQIVLANLVNIFLAVSSIFIISKHSQGINLRPYISAAVCINIIFFSLQKLGWSPVLSGFFPGKEGGLLGNAPRLVDYFTIVSPFLPLPLLICCGVVAFITKELMFFPVVAVVLFIRHDEIVKSFILTSVIGLMIFAHDQILNSLSMRWSIWKPTIEMILQKPLIGYGIGLFPYITDQFIKSNGYHVDFAFNSYLTLLFGFGLFALIPLWFILKYIKSHFSNTSVNLSLLALLILAFVEYPFEVPRLWMTIIVIISFYIKETEGKTHES